MTDKKVRELFVGIDIVGIYWWDAIGCQRFESGLSSRPWFTNWAIGCLD